MSYIVDSATIERLRWHAGFATQEDATSSAIESVSVATDVADSEQMRRAVDDVLQTLEQVNRDLNGQIPSETVGGATMLARALVAAVKEIVALLRSVQVDDGSRLAWKVETAWSAILDGDIDDLREHLADEEASAH